MTLSQANREAVRRFGKGAKCQSYPGGRRIRLLTPKGPATFNYPPGTDWVEILDALSRVYGKAGTSPEGT